MSDYGKPLSENPLVSIIIDTYYRPELLKRAVNCILEQTYGHIELIIVNNGATPETIEYLLKLEAAEKKVSLVHFKENQFSWDDPHLIVRVCYNAGLNAVKGELVFYQSDDDWVAPDFIERMVKLFTDNPKCTTAIGRVVNCLHDGTLLFKYPVNERSRYLDGRLLALDSINGGTNKLIQPNPGHSFVVKKDILIKAGGYHETFEYHQMLGIVPFGESAFDPEALMFWGRGAQQLNVILNKKNNFFWGRYFIDFIKNSKYSVIEKWRSNYGDLEAKKVENYLNYIVMQAYYRMIFSDRINLKFNSGMKFTAADREYMRNLPFDSVAFYAGLKESVLRSLLYRYFSIGKHVSKMFIKSPTVTLKRIYEKISEK